MRGPRRTLGLNIYGNEYECMQKIIQSEANIASTDNRRRLDLVLAGKKAARGSELTCCCSKRRNG